MEWNKHAVAQALQTARLRQGLTLEEVGEKAGVKPSVVSSLEKARHVLPPRRDTQGKLERALGISLPIPRDGAIRITFYAPASKAKYINEAVGKFQLPVSSSIMAALEKWSKDRAKLKKWNEEHPGRQLKE
ncbi:MAG TPA: helix-turn-helix transcriptional regulator [Candidatus Heimdallarchaeota archaeon]|nr:helix-turn-helix transcriptional regulator [Candidatus Heimdallarchaeota archaeon]